MTTVEVPRAGERAYRALREEILSGDLAPGVVLAETEQATRIGVSRTPMREALDRLEAEGLVEKVSARMTVVTDFDADDIRDLFDVRRALEEAAARYAAQRGAAEVFEALAAGFDRARPDEDPNAYNALIAEFDEAVDTAIDNAYFRAALQQIRTHLERARRRARQNPARLVVSAGEHRLIAAAIAAGDADLAAHATHIHLHNARDAILSSLTPQGAS